MDDDEAKETTVELYVYDLSRGLAALLSELLIGRHIEGVWHTGIVAYGKEYYFGPAGVQSIRPGGTKLQEPQKIEKLGVTYLPYPFFLECIKAFSTTLFAPGTYNLLRNNCNSFSQALSIFLVGTSIPKYILDLPKEILETPIGQCLEPLIEAIGEQRNIANAGGNRFVKARVERADSPEFELLNNAIEEARLTSIALEERRNVINEKLAKKERKKKKKEKKSKGHEDTGTECNCTGASNCLVMTDSEGTMAEMQATNGQASPKMLPSDRVLQMEEDEKRELEEMKRRRDPPIVFKDLIDVKAEYDELVRLLEEKLNADERTCLRELRQYVLEDEGSWALGDGFLNFVGRILYDKNLPSEARVKLLNILSVATLKDDVILLLHQDRKEHIIMNYAFDIDRHPVEEELPIAQFVANMFENLGSSEWLLYISEWQHRNRSISNIRVTTKVAVMSLLSDSIELQARGVAIIHNLACKEVKTVVFDEVAVELTMALLQYFNSNPAEEQLYACMKALARFTQISGQEVPQIIEMVGPNPNMFRGTSERIDELISQINKKLP